MTSAIDPTKPVAVAPTTQSVRDNFTAAKNEIEALQIGNTVVDAAADTTTWPMLARAQTGEQSPATDAGLSYNASTNVLATGEFVANGTAGGLEINNVNVSDSYQAKIVGSMSQNVASLNGINSTISIQGGAAATSLRGFIQNHTFTIDPATAPSILGLFNQFTFNSTGSPSDLYGILNKSILGAGALGGTIPNIWGYVSSLFIDAAATTNITYHSSFSASNIVNGALQTVTNARGFYGLMAAGSGRWNCYMSGTAINYMNGALLIGSTTDDTVNKLQVTGSATISGGLYVSGGVFDLPNYTTGTRPAAATGNMIYDTTLNKACIGTGAGTWQVITSV